MYHGGKLFDLVREQLMFQYYEANGKVKKRTNIVLIPCRKLVTDVGCVP